MRDREQEHERESRESRDGRVPSPTGGRGAGRSSGATARKRAARAPHPETGERTDGSAHLLRLQRRSGNRAVRDALAGCGPRTDGTPVSGTDGAPPVVDEALRRPGRPLDPAARRVMEPRFGRRLDHVRLHTDSRAAESARAVDARAYTVGRDIVFGAGEYAPDTSFGRRLLAHELTHVLQQGGDPSPDPEALTVNRPGDAAEREADRVTRAVVAGERAAAPTRSGERELGTGSVAASVPARRPPVPVGERSAPRVQRGLLGEVAGLFSGDDFEREELLAYLQGLDERGTIEGSTNSDNKARAVVDAWKDGGSPYVVTPSRVVLLIEEMRAGFTGDDDERAILELLERADNAHLRVIFGPDGVRPEGLNSDFHGAEWDRLRAFYRRRFRGGMGAVLAGRLESVGRPVPLGVPLRDWESGVAREDLARRQREGDRTDPGARGVRHPEAHHSYEAWIATFTTLPTFVSQRGGGQRVIGPRSGGAPAETATDPSAGLDARRPEVVGGGYLRADRFIDGPTDAWVRDHLPPRLVETAYQLPSDCADMAVILRHVWLVAHRRTEVVRSGGQAWLCGAALDESRSGDVGSLIGSQVYSGNVARVVRPYADENGNPLRSFDALASLLRAGDVLVWEHRRVQGGSSRRTGGHVQTVMHVDRTGEAVRRIDVLQGNQPIGLAEAEAIRAENPGAPSVSELREAPGRRIEVSELSGTHLRDVGGVWTWPEREGDGFIDVTTLVAAGPPGPRTQPATPAGAEGRRLQDWLPNVRGATTVNDLQSVVESAMLDVRTRHDAGEDVVDEAQARAFGAAVGERLWDLAKAAASARRQSRLAAPELAEESHYRPLQHLLGMVRGMGERALTRAERRAMTDALDRAGRGAASVDFDRSGAEDRRRVNVLVTGFDPFAFRGGRQTDPERGRWNPSGAAVLRLDGTTLPVSSDVVAAVEGVILPVSYGAFRRELVESVLRPHLADVDAVLTVSMDPGIAPTESPEIERYAVGVHRLNDDRLEAVPPAGGDLGSAIVEARGDVPGVAREAGLPAERQEGDRAVQFEFATAAEADRALAALNLPPQGRSNVTVADVGALRRVLDTMERGIDGTGITFRVDGRSFQARIRRGPGGSFLSNEVSYRVLRLLTASPEASGVTSFHVHTPRGTEGAGGVVPQDVSDPAARRSRERAVRLGRDVVRRLVRTLRAMIAAVARRAVSR